MNLFLENVRCFAGKHTLPLRPLTLLVGENSTGKTTVLAMLSMLLRSEWLRICPDFNNPPYELGGFGTIAAQKPGGNRATSFTVGLDGSDSIQARYVEYSGHCRLSKLSFRTESACLTVKIDNETLACSVQMNGNRRKKTKRELPLPNDYLKWPSFRGLMYLLQASGPQAEQGSVEHDLLQRMHMFETFTSEVSLAPIRTSPKRVYLDVMETASPEGGHIPVRLFRLADPGIHNGRENELEMVRDLEDFGRDSGMFEKIAARRLGDRPGDPFEVEITLAGQPVNLRDVGYGVSQALPIVFEILNAERDAWILLQQPEVHLHPRAQAALGSFFSRIAGTRNKRLIVETHSDFIPDRVRMEVASGTLRPEDVVILYFDRVKTRVRVYPIHVDRLGNIIDAPGSYRAFFLDETFSLLNRGQGSVCL